MPARLKAAQRGGGRTPAPEAPARRFTRAELAGCDGTIPERAILIAYRRRVYDVTASFMWMTGRHFWLGAGRDLTGRMAEGPHGEEVLARTRCVGLLVD